MGDLWAIIRRGSWRERVKAASLFLLLIGGSLSIGVLSWWLDGR